MIYLIINLHLSPHYNANINAFNTHCYPLHSILYHLLPFLTYHLPYHHILSHSIILLPMISHYLLHLMSTNLYFLHPLLSSLLLLSPHLNLLLLNCLLLYMDLLYLSTPMVMLCSRNSLHY